MQTYILHDSILNSGFLRFRLRSVHRGLFEVINSSNLQSALDILNQLFQSVFPRSVLTATAETPLNRGVCAARVRNIIYLTLPKVVIVYKYHPVKLRVGGYKRLPTISPLFTGITVGLTSQLLSHGKTV